MNLNNEQELIATEIISKIKRRGQISSVRTFKPFQNEYNRFIYRVGGLAGTGKTFLLSEIRKRLGDEFGGSFSAAFITFTGKASSVLLQKLTENNSVYDQDFIGTIHSFIYRPETFYDKQLKKSVIVGWTRRKPSEIQDYNVIFIDEASMVSEKIWDDLMSYGISIVAVGDHGQLPPVGDNGFSLMGKANHYLQEIQRQAMNSPIVKLAHYVRQGGEINTNTMYSSDVFCLSWHDEQCKKIFYRAIQENSNNMIVLCAFNKTRVKINNLIRNELGNANPEPYPGEKIVCLKNNHDLGIMNGNIASVVWAYPFVEKTMKITMEMDGTGDFIDSCVSLKCFSKEKYELYVDGKKFNKFGRDRLVRKLPKKITDAGYRNIDYFDFGYCISVHKSQGSEWDKVILFDQHASFWDDRYRSQWLYTALTRAKTKLFIIKDFF